MSAEQGIDRVGSEPEHPREPSREAPDPPWPMTAEGTAATSTATGGPQTQSSSSGTLTQPSGGGGAMNCGVGALVDAMIELVSDRMISRRIGPGSAFWSAM